MDKEIITFQLDRDKRLALDQLATRMEQDRSDLLNEAIALYLETHHWQVKHILEGIRQADVEEFVSKTEVLEAFAKWSLTSQSDKSVPLFLSKL